ncbi:phosphoglycerate kinase [Candidatus Nomurabacteria bacterium]|nr:phosphoglycerate kinase [Candidatus Nomurabacteria bacterium]
MTKHAGYVFKKKTIRDIEVHGKRILLRADFNVPLNKDDNSISSDYRISQTIPTIKYLIDRQCEVVIISHLGRPDGKKNSNLSLEQVAKRLEQLIETPINFVFDCVTDVTTQALKKLNPGSVTVLENVRFHAEEEDNDPEFAKKLIKAINPDYIVHDEFGVIHRAHASTEGISHLVPAVAGLLLEKEITTLLSAVEDPARPLVAVLGGAKISDKLPLVERFLDTADLVLIGGAMANNFIKSNGHNVGKSLIDDNGGVEVKAIVTKAKPNQLVLPSDVAISDQISAKSDRRDCGLDEVGDKDIILDLGYETMRTYLKHIKSASTVIWNGNLGMTELTKFAVGSEMMAEALSKQSGSTETIIGGGDTADFVLDWLTKHPEGKFSHISTGGGASLELLSGNKLPGVEALLDA